MPSHDGALARLGQGQSIAHPAIERAMLIALSIGDDQGDRGITRQAVRAMLPRHGEEI